MEHLLPYKAGEKHTTLENVINSDCKEIHLLVKI